MYNYFYPRRCPEQNKWAAKHEVSVQKKTEVVNMGTLSLWEFDVMPHFSMKVGNQNGERIWQKGEKNNPSLSSNKLLLNIWNHKIWVISTKPLYTHFLRRMFSPVFLLLPDLQIQPENLSQPTLEGMRQPGNLTWHSHFSGMQFYFSSFSNKRHKSFPI